jgi:hypothetical protein
VAEHERAPVFQEPLELAVADHRVQRVDARGTHLDQHVTIADLGLGYIGSTESVLAISLDDEIVSHSQAGDTAVVRLLDAALIVEGLLENLPRPSAAREPG